MKDACDFCTSRLLIVATLRCRPFVILYSDGGIQADDRQWATCALCLDLIEAGDVDGLLGRGMANYPALAGPEAAYLRHNLRILIGEFLANRI